MKRVLSLVLALVMVLGMIPTFAAEMTGGEHLLEHGFITGKPGDDVATKLDAGAALTRQELAALIAELMGQKDEAAVFAQPADYADADKIGAWAVPFVAYAQVNGWMSGKPGNLFDPTGPVPGQQLAAVLMNALGYTVDTQAKYATVIADAAGLGLAVPSGNLTRGQAFTAMWTAVSEVKVNGEEVTLGVKLGKLDPPAPVNVALAVSSVEANNLRTVRVNFNEEIDEDTVSATTVKLTKAGSSVVTARDLTADGKTLVLTITGVAQSDAVVLTLDGVKGVDGDELAVYTQNLTVVDVTVPTITGAVAVNAKQVEVFFSEPINYTKAAFQVLNDVKINDVVIIAKATPNDIKNSIIFDFPTVLPAGTHTIALSNMVDYATLKAPTASFSFTVVADTAAPEMIDAVAKNTTTIEVTFNERVEVLGTIKVNGVAATTVTPVANSNNTKFTLTGGFTALDLGAIVEVKIAYINQEDVVGNKVSTEKVFTFKVADDTALPTVVAEISSANKITLTFSKTMKTDVGTVTVKDSKGVTLGSVTQPFTFKANSNNTVLEILATDVSLDDMNAGQITVNIKGMKDNTIRQNLLPETNIDLNANDTKKPTVLANFFAVDGTTTADDTVTFYFSEAMETSTLQNLSNYVGDSLGSLATVSGAKVKSVAADAKSITITVPNFRAVKATEEFTVYAIKDVAGNMMVTATGLTAVVILPSTALTATAAETTDGTKVKVTFSTKVATIDPSAIKVVKASDSSDYAVFIAVELASDGMSAVFTANKSLGTNPALYELADNNITLIKNIYNASLSTLGGGLAITDKVKPTVAVATGAAAGEIKLTFSEAVNAADAAALLADLIVRDKDGALVDLTGVGISLTYTLAEVVTTVDAVAGFDLLVIGGLTTTENYSVELIARNVKDVSAQTNVVVALAATTVAAK